MNARLAGLWMAVLALSPSWAVDPAPPAVDRADPQAVAQAYLAAAARGDEAAAMALTKPDNGMAALLRLTSSQREVRQGLLRIFAEYALLPIPLPVETTAGAPVVAEDGQSAVVDVSRTAVLTSKLVLVQLEEGRWAVDLRASAKAGAPGGQSMLATQAEQLERLAERGQDVQVPSDNPWQCQNKLQTIAQALNDYADEHDGKYPLKDVWMDELLPYLDDGEKAFQCPSHAAEQYSYAFHEAMSEQKRAQPWNERRDQVLVACTGPDRANATFASEDLKTLAPRHGQLNTFAAADGNQRSLPAGMAPTDLKAITDRTQACAQRLRRLVDAAKKYAAEHGGFLPSATAWCDELRPYLRQNEPQDGGDPFVCPEFPEAQCTYAINEELAGAELVRLVAHRKLLLFVETGPVAPNTAVKPGATGPKKHRNEWNPAGEPFFHAVYLNGTVDSERRGDQRGPAE